MPWQREAQHLFQTLLHQVFQGGGVGRDGISTHAGRLFHPFRGIMFLMTVKQQNA